MCGVVGLLRIQKAETSVPGSIGLHKYFRDSHSPFAGPFCIVLFEGILTLESSEIVIVINQSRSEHQGNHSNNSKPASRKYD